jgi:hypothetical protein
MGGLRHVGTVVARMLVPVGMATGVGLVGLGFVVR